MLSVFRKNANNWFMVLIFAVITFVFVFTFGSWGGGNVSGQVPIAATVNGSPIAMSTFRVQYSSAFQTMQAYRPGFNAEKAREEKLDDTVLDRLITRELLAQAAEERGLIVGDDEIVKVIEERFFPGDKPFDLEEYKRIVNGLYGTTEARYEEQVRREIMAARMESILGDAQHVSEQEINETFTNRNNRADLDLVKIDPLFFKAQVKQPSDDEAKAWAASHKGDIDKFYTSHMNRYRQGKKVNARHILVKVAENASDDDKKKARAKLEEAKKRVDGGEDFAKVATEVSEDSSAKQGGSLGLFGEGAMVKPFEEAAFALKKGEISGVVESRFGFHVIKVEEIQDAVTKEQKDVETEIAKQLMVEGAQLTEAKKYAGTVLAELKKGTKMEDLKVPGLMHPPVAGQLPAPKPDDAFAPRIDNTGPFAQSARVVPKIGVAPELVRVAFALKADEVHPEVLEVNNRLFIVKLKTREQPDPKKLAEERDSIEASLLAGRRNAVIEELTKALRDKANIDKTPNLLDNG